MPSPLLKRQLLLHQLNQKINNNIESHLKWKLQNFFESLKMRVIAELEKYYNEEYMLQGQIDLILAPIHEAQREYYELLLDSNRAMYERGKQQGQRFYNLAQQTKASYKSDKSAVNFDRRELFGTLKFSEDYLKDYTFTASQHTIDRVDSEINQILTDGYKDGWGVADVRNRITERYDQFKGWEANRIARTEMQTAHNLGVMNTYLDLGVEYIQWRSAHDSRVRGLKRTDRADHIHLDGEIIRFGENFSNGLAYPGDKSGKIEEWINCRCSATPFLLPPGKKAPSFSPFREEDLVSVKEPWYGELLSAETENGIGWLNYEKVLQGKMSQDSFVPTDPNGELIDINSLSFFNSEQMYAVTIFNPKSVENPSTGNWEYKGLQADDKDGVFLYFKKESIEEHNQLIAQQELGESFTPEPVSEPDVPDVEPISPINEPIDISALTFSEASGNYLFTMSTLDYDENTDKYYYKGIEALMYTNDNGTPLYGKIPKEVIDQHNAQFDIPKEYIDVSEIKHYNEISDTYYISASDGLLKIGDKYYFKGLEVTDINNTGSVGKITGDAIKEHNKGLLGKEFDPTGLETSNLPTHEGEYVVEPELYGDAEYNPETGKYVLTEYNLEFDDYDLQTDLGYLKPETIKIHNLTVLTDGNPSIDTSQLKKGNAYKGYEIDATDPYVTYDPDTDTHYYKGVEFAHWYDTYGILYETHVIKHNLMVQNTPIPSPSTELEKIDTADLHEVTTTSAVEYFVSEYDGAVYMGNYKWQWKGVEWQGDATGFYLTQADVDVHNSQFHITTDISTQNTSTLTVDEIKDKIFTPIGLEADGDIYIIDKEMVEQDEDGHLYYKENNDIPVDYYFDTDNNQIFIIRAYDINKHNKKIVFSELPSQTDLSKKLTPEEQIEYDDLKGEIEEILYYQIKNTINDTLKVSYINDLDDYLPRFNELKNKALELIPENWIDINELDYNDNLGEYVVGNVNDLLYFPSEGVYKYKGLVITDYELTATGSFDKGYISKEQIETHNSKVPSKYITKEYIDIADLVDNGYGDYEVSSADGLEYKEDTDAWYYKGLEVDTYDVDMDKGYISPDDIEEHNKNLPENVYTKSPINFPDLEFVSTGFYVGHYKVKPSDPGVEYTNYKTKMYYKGLEIENYQKDTGFGYLTKEQIEAHNNQLNQGEFIDASILPYDSVNDEYDILKSDIEYNTSTHQYEYKGMKIDEDAYVNADIFVQVPGSDINEHNLQFTNGSDDKVNLYAEISQLKQDYDEDYAFDNHDDDMNDFDPNDITYDANEDKYYWKGIPIDYYDGAGYWYIEGKTMEQYMIDNDITAPLTKEDIDELEEFETSNGYYEFEIEDSPWHKSDLKYNEDTGFWEFKGLQIDYFDEDYYTVEIAVETVEEYQQYNTVPISLNTPQGSGVPVGRADAKPNNNTHNVFGSYLLEQTVENGIKYVIDENGHKWELDKLPHESDLYGGHLEERQDRVQDRNAHQRYEHYERESMAHWGHYGHQNIGNFFYPDSDHGWSHYKDLKDTKVLPLLNKMKEKVLIINDPDESSMTRHTAERQYQELWRQFANMVDEIYDDTHDRDLKRVLWEIAYMDSAIAKTPPLLQDTALVRYGSFDEEMCKIGEIFNLEGFLSTSYDDLTRPPEGTEHFASKCRRWKITILAPAGTPGARLNSFFRAYLTEREWLLDRMQDFEVLEYNLDDYDDGDTECKRQGFKRKRVTIRLVND